MNKIKLLLKEKKNLDKKKDFLDKRKIINKNPFLGFEKIHQKKFTKKENDLFARISGDVNPIHCDKIYTKNTFVGDTILHGVHLIVYTLNQLVKKDIIVKKIKASFKKLLFVNENLEFFLNLDNKIILITKNNNIALLLEYEIKSSYFVLDNQNYLNNKRRTKPKFLKFDKLKTKESKKFLNQCNSKIAKYIFPNLYKSYGEFLSSNIIDLSYLVGMECPGLYSLFSEIVIDIRKKSLESKYKIIEIDPRFKIINMDVKTNYFDAKIKAFYRPQEIVYPTSKHLSKIVKKNEFKEINALIIGGSRGLGNLTARLIIAGGGKATITYNLGKKEAKELLSQINDNNDSLKIFRYNIFNKNALKSIKKEINQIYYYATPKIFSKQSLYFDKLMFDKFKEYYVVKFMSLINKINFRNKSCSFFMPSTISINEPKNEIIEYTMAKLKAEIFVSKLPKYKKDNILIRRLPRLLTDQTNTILNNNLINKYQLELILNIIRELRLICIKK